MPIYRIKDWRKFQHYKDRNPPWIRLHRSLLDDYEFHCLPDASKALAPCLWLLASEHKDPSKGEIDATDDKIAFRLHMPTKRFQDAIKPLIENGFVDVEHNASELLANCKRVATPETETETEAERARVKRARTPKTSLEELSVDHIARWLAEKRTEGRYVLHDEHFILEYFRNYCQSRGKTYEDYIAAYRNAFEWRECQPKHQLRAGNSSLGIDTRDPATRARDLGEQIIAQRKAVREAAGILEGHPTP